MYDYFDRERFASLGLSLILQSALTAGLLYGLGNVVSQTTNPSRSLPVIRLTPEPPAQAVPLAPPAKSVEPEGASAPPAKKAKPKPVVAPEPEIVLETENPLIAAPAASDGMDIQSGATPDNGPGTGGGGEGNGTGSGRYGNGAGGVPLASRARYLSGQIRPKDYPKTASRSRSQGTVTVNFDVLPDGHVDNCRVVRTSGSADLDSTTCRLIEQRFCYEPARDAEGRAVKDVTGWEQRYWLD